MSRAPEWVVAPPPQQHVADTVQEFVRATGAYPDGVWAAPGRVNLVGEHLDYNGGPVLPLAIEHRSMVAVRRRRDGHVRLQSRQDESSWQGRLDDLRPGAVPGWAAYAAGVLWALREAGHELSGLDLVVDGRVPVGAGLSSSAALTCAVAVSLADLADLPGAAATDEDGRRALAQACMRAENEFAGAPTGGMDQAVVLRARARSALLLDCTTFEAEHVPFPLSGSGTAPDLALLVVDTRAHHSLVDGQYGSRRAGCEEAARRLGVQRLAEVTPDDLDTALGRLGESVSGGGDESGGDGDGDGRTEDLQRYLRHVVTETERVHRVVARLRAGRVDRIGEDLTASHVSMCDDYRISTPELDLVVESATDAGSLGARMTGGGFGGSAIALCAADAVEEVAAAVADAFARAGYRPPGFLPFAPSGPAERVA